MSFLGLRPSSRSSHTAKPFTSHSARSDANPGSQPPPRTGRAMAGVMDIERTRTRRERTFIGSECCVCEENLEYTLRGERILQLSCGHVSHEACFYEYIREFESQHCPTCDATLGLDTSRGGNVLDIEKLSTIVRSAQQEASPAHSQTHSHSHSHSQVDSHRSASNTPTPWDNQTVSSERQNDDHIQARSRTGSNASTRYPPTTQSRQRDSSHSRDRGSDRGGSLSRAHGRSDSGATGLASSNDYAATHDGRRHDYDVQSMESSLSSPRGLLKSPIPAPTVTVRSEFPTLSRSRQQQSLTCLITVEVVEGKWRPNLDDIRGAPPLPSVPESTYERSKSPVTTRSAEPQYEPTEALDEITEDLHARVDNWHGLDFSRFGNLRLHGHIRVGKDRQSWQELECYLFSEMLICVKEKKMAPQPQWDGGPPIKKTKCTLKGSILIKKHLNQVEHSADNLILTLSLSVAELPAFHLQFQDRGQLEQWRRALMDIRLDFPISHRMEQYDQDNSGTEDDDYRRPKRVSSINSSYGAGRSVMTAPTEYSTSRGGASEPRLGASVHVPVDIVVVIPVSSSMQGLKINLLRDTLRFLVSNLGERDRMGLVTFGSSGGGVPIVGMTSKAWRDWPKVLDSIRPVGQKSLRADVVDGANVAMDLLMQRKSSNPLSSILLISDSSTSDAESVDFVISRAEAAKVSIHSFGLGLTHKPDTMIELSTRTKASYTYVKDWMMLRECAAGCLGSLQTISHQNVKLKLRLPEGSPAKFVKISGALQITKRATGRDAEASLGDLRFGDKRDILVQLAIAPDTGSPEQLPQDPWESIVSGLEALGGPLDQDDSRTLSVEEVPLIQADLTYGDILREGTLSQLPRPSLLAITLLPSGNKKNSTGMPSTPPIPPHPHVVQRRMELLTSDMLTRALTLVSRGQHERAHHLLKETRSILKGLGKGGLPPLPPPGHRRNEAPGVAGSTGSTSPTTHNSGADLRARTPSPHADSPFTPAAGIDVKTMHALDAELESSLEWINHPAVFGRDSRKAVLQAIGVISSQRAYTFRSPSESLWAERIAGIKRLSERARDWRETGDQEALMEEN
ncbi:von Willebrand and RING finger domain containing protein [Pyrenophora tritici-repentis]|uniref:von Willebrand and RING finger domain containing protein n=3 Tax=Pyrenophora tritici-repentis TaxID=45151 RepID=A0A922NA25_9PLEO|nr:von Willebrand and RING finger domain containing protein [Pyrenophora tritici-repentis Pt-1C-BFP]EDU43852.1 von Willebrand and RING finger domain containing protein [Pyrenophora tritici-repentis Pt-1C-BFP]KAI1511567.1 von Willebrand and RING finger domain containing protein [Pyrenophora tritici-repentis]KAI1669359.1 von Willebrand and RING finger domain containing protein [Pyrenophora tritici-repentis]KAI1683752.1 von Willebrand and RING finger domain containing protein [Pyrenophora tritici-